jgi:hypothetical protein
MSEHHTPHVEASHERVPTNAEHHEQSAKLHEKLKQDAAEARDNREHIPSLEHKAKEQALPAEKVGLSEHGHQAEPSTQYVGRELKNMTLQRTLTRVRHKLSGPDKSLSKVIHQPVVDAVSRVGEQTVARPSGVLGGAICAFLGSCLFLWASKHYGFRYNYFLFFLFFVGGFAIGLVIELMVYLSRRKQIV